ncbi:DsrE family protein [Bradyrhizobium manausense]|uniref:DsrE family protein n=1 Tax=Bradyrhizobium TaxID=374 RepID=UPI001BA69D44|nr:MULTISPECIES: DsrE family protein [Bradyrhizobium]MBR0826603.1 DsrE family protein [Bradyrhizobium manausense]UVO28992.1 DsrE family protein [Bradyrhizobium arachidis]
MIPSNRLSRRGLVAGASIFTAAASGAAAKEDRLVDGVVILIDSNEPYVMGHAISYSANLAKHFAEKGAKLQIEVVANGKGIEVFRADKTPLAEPLATLRQAVPNLAYSMCASSKTIAEAKEHISIPLISGANLVPFGIGRVVDLQLKGWAYIHA